MPGTKFYYNPKTLRYERVKFSVARMLLNGIGYIAFGALFFVALIFLQNLIIETPSENQLRAENKALKHHKVLLTAQLGESNSRLSELKQQDQSLYLKLFEIQTPALDEQVLPEREEILVSDASDFNESIMELGNRFSELIQSAKQGNKFFGMHARVGKSDVEPLTNTPAIAPIRDFEIEKLVSGYGTRINPFHKGNYHHDGVDLAAPRGTAVLASAPGRIIQIKRSDLLAGYGNYVEIDHGNGFITRYSHMEEIEVRAGQQVKKDEIIGTVGSTGGSIAPHLHYEVIKDGVSHDPIRYFMEGLTAAQYEALLNLARKQNQSLD